MFQRLCVGQLFCLLSCFLCSLGAGFEAVAVVACFEDVAAVCKPIQESRCHLCIPEDLRPFREAEVGRDDDAGALVELAEQMEEQRPAR